MRILKAMIFLILVSCNSKDIDQVDSPIDWSENKKRQYFKDSIAYRNYNGRYLKVANPLNNADTFFSKSYGLQSDYYLNTCILYALEEDFINPEELDTNVNFLRITIDPTFQIPYGIILKQEKTENTLSAKMTDGHGGYHSGYLDITLIQKVENDYTKQIFEKLEKFDFFNLPSHIKSNGSDGETWRIELIRKGKYHSITRWTANHTGDSITREIGKLGMELLDKSKLFEYWALQNDISEAR